MEPKPIGLRILFWCEIIVAARTLLFVVPVLINRYLNERFIPSSSEDWFIIIITMIALFYLSAGIAGLLEFKMWKVFHYLVMGMTIVLTFGLHNVFAQVEAEISMVHYVPAILSIVIAVLVTMLKSNAPSRA